MQAEEKLPSLDRFLVLVLGRIGVDGVGGCFRCSQRAQYGPIGVHSNLLGV